MKDVILTVSMIVLSAWVGVMIISTIIGIADGIPSYGPDNKCFTHFESLRRIDYIVPGYLLGCWLAERP